MVGGGRREALEGTGGPGDQVVELRQRVDVGEREPARGVVWLGARGALPNRRTQVGAAGAIDAPPVTVTSSGQGLLRLIRLIAIDDRFSSASPNRSHGSAPV